MIQWWLPSPVTGAHGPGGTLDAAKSLMTLQDKAVFVYIVWKDRIGVPFVTSTRYRTVYGPINGKNDSCRFQLCYLPSTLGELVTPTETWHAAGEFRGHCLHHVSIIAFEIGLRQDRTRLPSPLQYFWYHEAVRKIHWASGNFTITSSSCP